MKKHIEVVCAVIKKDNKIFCTQRGSKGECAYKWEFPGGKIELGETNEAALIREIKEELDCSIKIKNYITTVNHEYNTFTVTLHVYLCELVEGEPELREHVNSMWCDKDKLKELEFAEADYKFLDKIEKILEALEDIKELNASLSDTKYFHDKSNEIYDKIDKNNEYKKYIGIMKTKLKMHGNNNFKTLEYRRKREVFKLFIASIDLYILKEIIDAK